jgi:hypothetical protein
VLTVINTGEERTFLQGISWNLYEFYQLQSGRYVSVDRSPTFPILSPDRVLEFITDCQTD